jgi:hypothetical protein
MPALEKRRGVMPRGDFSKILALSGTPLVCFPLLAPVFFSIVSFLRDRRLRLDYLLPADCFPIVLIGGLLVLAVALRARSHRRLIGGSLAVAAVAPAGGQGMAVAVATGMASGAVKPAGWPWVTAIACIIVCLAAVAVLGAGGLILSRRLFGRPRPPEGMR